MNAILNNSMLNPLASCFVPSNMKIFEDKTGKSPNVKDCKKVVNDKSRALMILNPVFYPDKRKVKIFVSCTNDILGPKHYFTRLVNENVYFMKDYINLAPSKSECITWSPTDLEKFLESMLSFSFSNQHNLSVTYDVHPDTSNKSLGNEKCDCPPMFGCIIPPDFFGNPFGLNYSCNIKQAHVCHYSERSGIQKCNTKDKELDKGEESKLEQYSKELSKIIKEVCEIVSLATDYIEDSGYNEEINSIFELNTTVCSDDQINAASKSKNSAFNKLGAISINTDSLNLENIEIKMEIPKDSPVIDDFHALLDEGISIRSNNEGISPVVKKTIESSFSPKSKKEKVLFDHEILEKVACNPPCSVWCDSLPQPPENTYGKFIKNLSETEQELSSSSCKSQNRITTIGRPLCKRSFSANDCIWPENEKSFLTLSNKHLFGKHTENKFNLNPRMKIARSSSLPLSEKSSSIESGISSLNSSEDCQSSMWGPFDGKDSLWQTLPDCVPPNEIDMKQSKQKRVRELKSCLI